MKTFHTKVGPFDERPFLSPTEIDRMCLDELRRQALYPSKPSPIRIDRFVEKRFGIHPSYEALPAGLLGFTVFDAKGVQAIVVSSRLDDEGTTLAERRVRTTLAHEAGHGLLHAHLFVLASESKRLFGSGASDDGTKVLCRDLARRSGLSEWWEYQANLVMAGLLLPRSLVDAALDPLCVRSDQRRFLPPSCVERAIRRLSETFDVNSTVAQMRLKSLSMVCTVPQRSKGWPFVRRVKPARRPSFPT